MFAAISYIMAFAEFPVPFLPSFARMDLSDFPALVGAFAFGSSIGVMIELVKNGLQLLSTFTGGVGANTPGIIKYPFWQMTAENPKTTYACINYGKAYCPKEIGERVICIEGT